MTAPTDPFFIVGVQRSGNTLLGVMLGHHSDLYVGAHATVPAFFTGYEQNRLAWDADLRHRPPADQALAALGAEARIAALCAGLAPHPGEGLQAFLRRAAHTRALEQGKTVWGDMGTGELEYIPGIRFYFPTARFIHVIRDGRAVARSLRDRQYIPLPMGMHVWKRQVAHGRLHGAFLGPAHYAEVRYEALVRDPEPELRRLCAFLGVPYQPALCDLAATPATGIENAYVARRLDPTRIAAWKEALTAPEVRRLEHLAGDLLLDLGYPLQAVPPEGPFRALSPLGYLWQNQRRHFRALRLSRKTVMRNRQLVEVAPPLGKRLKRFLAATARLWVHPRLASHFRRRKPMV